MLMVRTILVVFGVSLVARAIMPKAAKPTSPQPGSPE